MSQFHKGTIDKEKVKAFLEEYKRMYRQLAPILSWSLCDQTSYSQAMTNTYGDSDWPCGRYEHKVFCETIKEIIGHQHVYSLGYPIWQEIHGEPHPQFIQEIKNKLLM